jgi:hypothetical protein
VGLLSRIATNRLEEHLDQRSTQAGSRRGTRCDVASTIIASVSNPIV